MSLDLILSSILTFKRFSENSIIVDKIPDFLKNHKWLKQIIKKSEFELSLNIKSLEVFIDVRFKESEKKNVTKFQSKDKGTC